MNINEVVKKENVNKKYIVNYEGRELVVKIVKCSGDNYDVVRIIKDDENGYMDRYLAEFMYMSKILSLKFEEYKEK